MLRANFQVMNSHLYSGSGPRLALHIENGNVAEDSGAGASAGLERIATLHAQPCHCADTLGPDCTSLSWGMATSYAE